MPIFSFTDAPIEIRGLEVIDVQNQNFWRLPEEETRRVSESVASRGKLPVGGRVRFCTDSARMTLKMELHTLGVDPCIAICGSGGADVMLGAGLHSAYIGHVNPCRYDNKTPEKTFELGGGVKQITINLPRNERLAGLTVEIDEGARLLPPPPFRIPGKICFYGSSITEGGCCSRPGCAYTAAVARWLDTDYVNYGFSGAARGETAMADIICRRKFSAIVIDYDHNAPSVEHLKNTHEPFFRRVRAAHPDTPILLMTRPDFDQAPEACARRRSVIRETFDHAVASGDGHAYFLDGERLFGVFGREMCSVDGTHPNDLGFYRMAEQVYGVLARLL